MEEQVENKEVAARGREAARGQTRSTSEHLDSC